MPDESTPENWPDGSIGVVADGDALFVGVKMGGKTGFVEATGDPSLESAQGAPVNIQPPGAGECCPPHADHPHHHQPRPGHEHHDDKGPLLPLELFECTGPNCPVCRPTPGHGWRFSDYITRPTLSQQRERLRLHIREVSDVLSRFQSRNGGDGWSYSRYALSDYLKNLKAELDALDRQAGRNRSAAFIGMR